MYDALKVKPLCICLSSEKLAHRRKRARKDGKRAQQVAEVRDESEEEVADSVVQLFKIEEVSNMRDQASNLTQRQSSQT